MTQGTTMDDQIKTEFERVMDKLKSMNGQGLAIAKIEERIVSIRAELKDQKEDADKTHDRLSKNIGELFALQRKADTKINSLDIQGTATSTKLLTGGAIIMAVIGIAVKFL